MTVGKLHDDEVLVEPELVRELIADQFPRWAHLPLARVPSDGTDNVIYRLGEQLSVRLPRTPTVADQIRKEDRWLPVVDPLVPLAVPLPIASGQPGCGYPFPWSVRRWLPGRTATRERITDPRGFAQDLAGFVNALSAIDASDGPPPGSHNFLRGVPLHTRDEPVRAALPRVRDMTDADAAEQAWEEALRAPRWPGDPVWIHGDLQGGNLLMDHGRLSAAIDFGGLGVGDPACDVMAAWTVLPASARDVFRDAVKVDDATWARARGWVVSVALIALPYYRHTNPAIVAKALHWLGEIFQES